MGLKISRAKGESYYLIITNPLEIGSYIKIERERVDYWDWESHKKCAKDIVEAPNGILILREEIIAERGCLEKIINEIRQGTFNFKTENFKKLNKETNKIY